MSQSVQKLAARSGTQSRRLALLKRTGLFATGPSPFAVTRAISWQELLDAYGLVHDVFVEAGYIRPRPSGLRVRCFEALPETATFVARANEHIAGVQTLVIDSPDLGLPSDSAFRVELDRLRRPGRRICEVTNEAVVESYRGSAVSTEVMRGLYAHAVAVACTDLVASVSPGHVRFYELLGFQRFGGLRSYSGEVEDPVEMVHMDFDAIPLRVARVEHGQAGDDAFLKDYYYDSNPHHRWVKAWALRAERTFEDPLTLREMFVVRSDLLRRCSDRELEAIRRRWDRDGRDVFSRVWPAQKTEPSIRSTPSTPVPAAR